MVVVCKFSLLSSSLPHLAFFWEFKGGNEAGVTLLLLLWFLLESIVVEDWGLYGSIKSSPRMQMLVVWVSRGRLESLYVIARANMAGGALEPAIMEAASSSWVKKWVWSQSFQGQLPDSPYSWRLRVSSAVQFQKLFLEGAPQSADNH